ncbi:MAG: hypothetical protein WCV69_00780 [Patescibacteria group bacterium]|jgi:hypothetical protein
MDSTNQLDFFKEFGLEDLPEEKKQEIQEQIMELVTTRFNRVVLTRLSEGDKQALDKLLGDNDPEKADQFIATKVSDYKEIYQSIIDDLKVEMGKVKTAIV